MIPPPLNLAMAYLGPVLLAGALALHGLPRKAPRWARWGALACCTLGLLWPLGGLPAAGYFLGAAGQFSLTTIFLLGCDLVAGLTGRNVLPHRDRCWLLAMAALVGLPLCLLSLGIVRGADPYEAGFGSPVLLLALLGVTVLMKVLGLRTAAWIPLVVLAWQLRLLESANLWDYLVDPFVTGYAILWLAWQLCRRVLAPVMGRPANLQ